VIRELSRCCAKSKELDCISSSEAYSSILYYVFQQFRFEVLMEIVPKIERFYEILEDLQSAMDKMKMKVFVIKVPIRGSVESILGEMEEVQVGWCSSRPRGVLMIAI